MTALLWASLGLLAFALWLDYEDHKDRDMFSRRAK